MLFSKYCLLLRVLVNHCPVSHLISGKSDLRLQGAIQAHGLASFYMESPSNFSYRDSGMGALRLSCLSIPLLHYRFSDSWAVGSMTMMDMADLTLGIQWSQSPHRRQAWCNLELACVWSRSTGRRIPSWSWHLCSSLNSGSLKNTWKLCPSSQNCPSVQI